MIKRKNRAIGSIMQVGKCIGFDLVEALRIF